MDWMFRKRLDQENGVLHDGVDVLQEEEEKWIFL